MTLFSYPFGGVEDVDGALVGDTREAGFEAGFTSRFEAATATDEPYLLPRLPRSRPSSPEPASAARMRGAGPLTIPPWAPR